MVPCRHANFVKNIRLGGDFVAGRLCQLLRQGKVEAYKYKKWSSERRPLVKLISCLAWKGNSNMFFILPCLSCFNFPHPWFCESSLVDQMCSSCAGMIFYVFKNEIPSPGIDLIETDQFFQASYRLPGCYPGRIHLAQIFYRTRHYRS